jgi:membrane protein DedA with SNARE-associated domain
MVDENPANKINLVYCKMFLPYLLAFVLSFLVDLIPFVGPPAWMAMVYCQIKFHLNVWLVLVVGVIGSTIGRYMLALYMPYLSAKIISRKKDEDLQFVGGKLKKKKWQVQLFVFLYTLIPVPTTPLFTAIGMARMNPLSVVPAFFIGKFASDALMVHAGKFAAENIELLMKGLLSWKTLVGTAIGLILLFIFLFIDWRNVLEKKKFRISFSIWK